MGPVEDMRSAALDNLLYVSEGAGKKIEELIAAAGTEEIEVKHGRHYKGHVKTREWWTKDAERQRRRKRIAVASRNKNRGR